MWNHPPKMKKKDPSEKAASTAEYDKRYKHQSDRKFQAKWQIGRPRLKLDDKKGMLRTVCIKTEDILRQQKLLTSRIFIQI